MSKKNGMKARGVRFTDEQWTHLTAKAGRNSTPSEINRQLVDADIVKDKKKARKASV